MLDSKTTMPDRIDKIRFNTLDPLEAIQVEESKDALDEEKKGAGADDAEEGEENHFQSTTEERLQRIMSQAKAQKTLEIHLSTLAKSVFLGVDIKTEPSALFLQLKLKSSRDVYYVRLSLPREVAMALKSYKLNSLINLSRILKSPTIWVSVLEIKKSTDDEVTKISSGEMGPIEKTLSQTFKLHPDLTVFEQMGIIDHNTQKFNMEVLLAYSVAFLVGVFLIVGSIYLSF